MRRRPLSAAGLRADDEPLLAIQFEASGVTAILGPGEGAPLTSSDNVPMAPCRVVVRFDRAERHCSALKAVWLSMGPCGGADNSDARLNRMHYYRIGADSCSTPHHHRPEDASTATDDDVVLDLREPITPPHADGDSPLQLHVCTNTGSSNHRASWVGEIEPRTDGSRWGDFDTVQREVDGM